MMSGLLNAAASPKSSSGSLNRAMVCDVYLAFVRICIEVKNYSLKSVEEVENIVRKQFREGDEDITRNEFVSILCSLCKEGRVPQSILLNY